MKKDQRLTTTIRRDSIEFKKLTKKEIKTGLIISIYEFLQLLAFVLFLCFSYSLWGNPVTPMRHLFYPALIALVLSLSLRLYGRTLLYYISGYKVVEEDDEEEC